VNNGLVAKTRQFAGLPRPLHWATENKFNRFPVLPDRSRTAGFAPQLPFPTSFGIGSFGW